MYNVYYMLRSSIIFALGIEIIFGSRRFYGQATEENENYIGVRCHIAEFC